MLTKKRLGASSKKYIKKQRKNTYSKTATTRGVGSYRPTIPRNIVNFGSGFPRMAKVNLKYTSNFQSTATTTTGTQQIFSANGLYDPDYTGAGHQPYYFDQMMAIYNHYCVIGAKLTLMITAKDDNTVPLQFCFGIDDDATLSTTGPIYQAEWSDANYAIMPMNNGQGSMTRSINWSAKKFFGRDPLDNTELQGDSSHNPTEVSNFFISVQPMDGGTINQGFYASVIIEYIAIFKELKNIAAS